MKLKQADIVAIAGIILAITFSIAFFSIVGKSMMEESKNRQSGYLKVTKGVPQINIPN